LNGITTDLPDSLLAWAFTMVALMAWRRGDRSCPFSKLKNP